MSGQFTIDIPAGPIFDNDDAQVKCPIVCASRGGTWNGQGTAVVEDAMSVCGCTFTVSYSIVRLYAGYSASCVLK